MNKIYRTLLLLKIFTNNIKLKYKMKLNITNKEIVKIEAFLMTKLDYRKKFLINQIHSNN